jgi:hypothetical protein
VLGETKRFADQAPQAIALDCIAGGFHGDSQTDAGKSKSIGLDAQTEETIVNALARGIQGIELQLAAQAQFGAQA